MLKRLLIIFLTTLASCSLLEKSRAISSDICWGELQDREKLSGNAIMYYFPENSVFITNNKCTDKAIEISMKEEDKRQFINELEKYKNNENFIGMEFKVRLSGILNKNNAKSKPLLHTDFIAIYEEELYKKPIFIK